MSKDTSNKISVSYDFEQRDSIEAKIYDINKNLIILSHNIQLKDSSNNSVEIWLSRLDYLFNDLKNNGYNIDEKEKMHITITKMNDEVFQWYSQNNLSYSEFKQEVFLRNKIKEDENMFSINEWVRIYDENDFPFNRDKFETGFINKILENDVYEIMCKGKILKIQGACIEKL